MQNAIMEACESGIIVAGTSAMCSDSIAWRLISPIFRILPASSRIEFYPENSVA